MSVQLVNKESPFFNEAVVAMEAKFLNYDKNISLAFLASTILNIVSLFLTLMNIWPRIKKHLTILGFSPGIDIHILLISVTVCIIRNMKKVTTFSSFFCPVFQIISERAM